MIIDLLNEYWKEIATALFVAWAIWISKSVVADIIDRKLTNEKIKNLKSEYKQNSKEITKDLEQQNKLIDKVEERTLEFAKEYFKFKKEKEEEILKLKAENKKLKASSKKK